MKFVFIYLAVSQFLLLLGSWKTVGYTIHEPTCNTDAYPPGREPVPWYTIDLDTPPVERWKQIMTENGPIMRRIRDKLKRFLRDIAHNSSVPVILMENLVPILGRKLPSPIREEIEGIAKYGNVTFGEAVLFNLFYDLSPLHVGCTSIVAQTENGTIYHARNLDYGIFAFKNVTLDMRSELREGTISIRFMKNGKLSFVSSGYVGYAGLTTAMKPNAFTFSFNARHPPGQNVNRYLKLVEYMLGRKTVHMIAPVTRYIMENVTSYADALTMLQQDEMVAPVYYILGGTKPGQGCILSKGTNFNDLQCLNKDRWYVLQTNFDHWKPPGDQRRYYGQYCMNQTGQTGVDWPSLYNVLSTDPVLNEFTTYTTLMQVNNGFVTYARWPTDAEP